MTVHLADYQPKQAQVPIFSKPLVLDAKERIKEVRPQRRDVQDCRELLEEAKRNHFGIKPKYLIVENKSQPQ